MAIHNGRWWIARGAAGLLGGGALAALWVLFSGGSLPTQCSGALTTLGGQPVTVNRASPKYCTNASGVMIQLGNNVASVEPSGLSVEGATTNLVLWSEDFSNASWSKVGVVVLAPVVTADTAVAPNGTTTADTIALPLVVGAGAASVVSQQFLATAAPYSASVYLKAPSGTSTIYLSFCLASAGTCNGVNYLGTTSCPVVSTGWSRCKAENVTLTAANYVVQAGVDLRDLSQLTQGAQSVFAWGAQLEAQQAATSYVPTNASTASRVEDKIAVPNPVTAGSQITVGATCTPLFNWNTGSSRFLVSSGSFFAANTFNAGFSGGGFMSVSSLDATATARTLNSNAAVAAGFLPHRFTFTIIGATITATKDGVNYPGTLGGTGVTPSSQNPTITLGNLQTSGGSPFWGWISNVCVDLSSIKCQ